jgi:hypothetical protein
MRCETSERQTIPTLNSQTARNAHLMSRGSVKWDKHSTCPVDADYLFLKRHFQMGHHETTSTNTIQKKKTPACIEEQSSALKGKPLPEHHCILTAMVNLKNLSNTGTQSTSFSTGKATLASIRTLRSCSPGRFNVFKEGRTAISWNSRR